MDISVIYNRVVNALSAENSLFSIAARGGILMIVLLVISIIALAIIIDRLVQFRKAKINKVEFIQEINNLISKNQTDRAIQLCEEHPRSPQAKIIALAIENYEVGVSKRKEILEAALKKELRHFEQKLGTLSTFASISPLIGFLGTVTGMVKVFMKIGETGGGVDISMLANGIWEALITTVGGLTVGIVAILFYNYLIGRVEDMTHDIDDTTNDFLNNYRRVRYGEQTA